MLYAPAFAATAITDEKEHNTYDLLFATLLRPRDIVAGKLCSSIIVLLLFVLLSLPVLVLIGIIVLSVRFILVAY